MLTAQDLFNEGAYLAENPDVAAAIAAGTFSSGFEHFTLLGKFEGRDSGPLFDDSFYQATNPDVSDAVEQGLIPSLFDHFLAAGQFEGRDPIADFDTAFYLQNNPDVDAIVGDSLTAYQHFVQFGQFEPARDPSDNFDTDFYINSNPDVSGQIASGITTALQHFILFGLEEGRRGDPPPNSENLGTAIDLGVLSGSLGPITDMVSPQNRTDIYRFSLGAPSTVGVGLDGLTQDADVELIFDTNGNGLVEPADIFAFSVNFNTLPESLSLPLSAGTYFVRVSLSPLTGSALAPPDLPAPQGETSYNLTVSAS